MADMFSDLIPNKKPTEATPSSQASPSMFQDLVPTQEKALDKPLPAEDKKSLDNRMAVERVGSSLSFGGEDIIRSLRGDAPRDKAAEEARATALTQGVLDASQDIMGVVADVADSLGADDWAASQKKAISSERAQYENLPGIKDTRGTSVARGLGYAAATLLPAAKLSSGVAHGTTALQKGLGLAPGLMDDGVAQIAGRTIFGKPHSTLAGQIVGDIAGGAALSGIQPADPESETPLQDRMQNAAKGGAFAGGVGTVLRGAQAAIRGPATFGNIAKQHQTAGAYRNAGIEPPVAQVLGSEGLDAIQTKLSQVPLLGGKGELLKVRDQVGRANARFVDSLAESTTQADDTIFNIHNSLKAQNLSVDLTPAHRMSAAIVRAIESKGNVQSPISDRIMAAAENVQTTNNLTFRSARAARENIDSLVRTVKAAKGNGMATDAEFRMIAKLRGAVESSIERSAGKVGMAEDYSSAKQVLQQQVGYKQLKDIWDKSSPGLVGSADEGAIKPIHPVDLQRFTREFQKNADDIYDTLTPENKAVMKGLLVINDNMKNIINQVKPGAGIVSSGISGGTAIGAATLIGGLKTAALAGGIKGFSYMLNSDAGRAVLTYAGRSTAGEAKGLTYRLMQGFTNAIVNRQLNQQPEEE